ncbi:MAG: nucleotidyltransferase family protein [Clostridiaceae bacterium]|nr:nucleotidyltransferase family protein [Clostridiaceae bacterium]
MKICGITVEYNPFHNGHLYQIARTRELLGADTAIVCCMSGDFIQRGEAAIMNKSLRAEAAVRCGADLVLSLPLRYSLSSAQGFADGAVHILTMAGARYISFGAEDEDTAKLLEIANLILEKSVIEGTIKNMQEGLSFALARERELFKRIKERSAIISKPNNILGVEYIRAVIEQNAGMEPIAIPRAGSVHDGDMALDGIASASYLRKAIRAGNTSELGQYMPKQSLDILLKANDEGLVMADISRLDCAITAVLSRQKIEDIASLPDASEGIEYRLASAIEKGRTFDEICDLAKTKRYAHSRIRRMLYCAFLGIEARGRTLPTFTRVLAFNNKGREVLSAIEDREGFAFITKPASAKKLPHDSLAEFELEARAASAYDMALPGFMNLQKGREWTKGPVYVRRQE